MGTEHSRQVLKAMRDYLESRLTTAVETGVAEIVADNGRLTGIVTDSGELINCRYLILSPGREGADWLMREAGRLKMTTSINPIDIGVRVEVPNAVMAELSSVLYEAKLEFISPHFDDRIRTFCMCPAGEVIMESTGGYDPVLTVNATAMLISRRKTPISPFSPALLLPNLSTSRLLMVNILRAWQNSQWWGVGTTFW